MIYKFQYETENERNDLINAHNDRYLIEEQNIAEGNFLVFTDAKPIDIEVVELKQENVLLKAQNQALANTAEFHGELIVELAMQFYD